MRVFAKWMCSPQFAKCGSVGADVLGGPSVDLEMNSTAKLAEMTLDVAPINALSATSNGATLLVSDTEGRIWLYEGTEATEGAEGTSPASTGTSTGEGDSSLLSFWSFKSLSQTSLPRYRDIDLSPATYAYKVSALSRFYTAGNSTPTETESVASEPVAVTVGGVRFFWNDVVCKVGETAAVMLSIENALNFNVTGRVQVVSYDPAYLEPADLIPSGLAEKIKYTSSFADGQWTITLTEGVLPAGSGKFFTLVFRTLRAGETRVCGGRGYPPSEASCEAGAMRGATVLPADETVGATVTISSAPTYQLGDVNGDGKVDLLDLRLLAKLKSAAGRKYNSDQLRAGDFNGNGKLDNADYQALRALLKERGLL